jgi:hypothetical protein
MHSLVKKTKLPIVEVNLIVFGLVNMFIVFLLYGMLPMGLLIGIDSLFEANWSLKNGTHMESPYADKRAYEMSKAAAVLLVAWYALLYYLSLPSNPTLGYLFVNIFMAGFVGPFELGVIVDEAMGWNLTGRNG